MFSSPLRQGMLVLGLMLGLPVSGCVTASGPADTVAAPSPSSTQAIDAPAPDAAPSSQASLAPAPIAVPNPDSLVGYSEEALENLFGEPSFTRRDPPAELWQYRNDVCTLDLFLYEASAGVYSVEHLEFRETIMSKEDIEYCLRAIIEQKLAAASAF